MSAIDDLTAKSDLDIGYLNRRVDDWDVRLRALYAYVENWLPDEWSVQSEPTVTMHEELMRVHGMPARQVPALNLQDSLGKRASLRPKGLWIIGANGSVDLRTPRSRYVIVDVAEDFAPPHWNVSSPDDRSRLQPLNRDFVQAALS